jgi:hypothetical protein
MNSRLLLLVSAALASACAQSPTHVIASTATVIGVDLGQGQATQAVTGTLGYKRAEFAIVPTDKSAPPAGGGASADPGGSANNRSAKNAASVIMELSYSGIFSNGGGIYQRLAIGDAATIQNPATALLFAKNPDGSVSPQSAAIAQAAAGQMVAERQHIDVIAKCFDNNGAVDTTKRDAAIAKATGAAASQFSSSSVTALKKRTTTQALAEYLGDLGNGMVPGLFDSLPDNCK